MDLFNCDFLSPYTKDLVHRFQHSKETDSQSCFGMVQALKKEAEGHIKTQTFLYAECCYKFALKSIISLRQKTSIEVISSHDEAILWSNISFVKCKQNKYEEAFQDALISIKLDQGYSKGYWRASQAKCGLNNFAEAATYLLHFLACVQPTDDDFVNFISEVAILIPKIKSYQEWKAPNILTTESPLIWYRILKMLYEHDEYKALGILTVGTCGDSQVPETFIHKMAAVPKLDLSFVNVGKVLKFLAQKEVITKKWHLQLAEFVVYRGANIRSIAECFSKPVLVAVTELCIVGEWPSFLSLVWDRITPDEYDDADCNGNTPLHIYVKSPKHSSNQAQVVFHELMRKGCLSFLVDQSNKIPLEYVTEQDPCYYFLHEAEAVCRNARLERLKFLHDTGNKAWKENKWTEAIHLYKYALIIAQIYSHSSITVLYSNLSAAYFSINDYKQALETADNCLKKDQRFIKGYFRKGQALVKLGEKVKAFETYITGFKITTETMFQISFVEESVKLLNTMPGKSNATLIKRLKQILLESWPGFLEGVTQNKKWDLLALLILGPPYDDPTSIKQGIMGSCDAGRSVMSTFMPTFFESLGQLDTGKMSELLLKLLKQGASPAGLSLPDETYFHTVVKFSITTRDIQVLQWILKKDKEHSIVSAADRDGHTPLHTLCIEQEKRKENSLLYTNIAELLLAKGVHVGALDRFSRQAADYVSEGSELKIYLKIHENTVKSDFTPKSTDLKNWKDIKAEGNTAYGQGNYELAKDLYSDSIRCLEMEIQKKQPDLMLLNDEDGHNLAILYGNRAECWYKLNDKRKYLEDAKKNVDFDGSWFKGHQRVAKAFREKGKVETALKAYVNAYKTLKYSDGAKNRMAVISDMVDCAFQLKMDPTKCFQDLKIAATTFAILTYELIKKKEWLKAEYTESLACNSSVTTESFNPDEIDLACICDRDQLKVHYKWVCRLILFFLRLNVELTKLKFHPGDTFFHAIVSIAALNTIPPVKFKEDSHMILFHVVDTIIVPQKLQNVKDDKGNTVLHFIASLKGSEPMRQYLTHYLFEKGVNVMARNNDNALAIDLTKANDVVRYILQSYMDKEAAITKAVEKQKEEENKSKKQIKKETVVAEKRQQKESIPTKVEVKPKAQTQTKNNQQPDETDKKKKEKSNVSAASKKLCDFCERKLDDALEYQKDEEYERAYLQLVEVINTQKHQSDPRHKKLKQTSIQRVAALLSIVDTHEIPKSLIKNISSDGIKDILYELAKTGKWIQLENFVTQVKSSDRGKALGEFARSLSLTNVIKESSLNGQTESKMRIIDLLLEYGARVDRSESPSALTCSMNMSDWKLVIKLLRLGANPKGVTLNPKDTPNHAALQVALSLDPGNFTILEELRNIYMKDKDKSGFSYLSTFCQDEDGNTLLHLSCKVKFSSHSLRAVELLCEWQAPADLKNKEGKLPIEYLTSKNDRRAQYIKAVMGSERKVASAAHSARSRDKTSVKVSDQQVSNMNKNTNQKFREDAMKFLSDLPDANVDFIKSVEEDSERYSDNEESDEEEENTEDLDTYGEDTKIEFEGDDMDDENIKTVSKEDESAFNIDVGSFDNLAWDVECTEDVWNILRSRKERRAPTEQNTEDNPLKKSKKEKLSDSVKKIIVKYIYQLAKGQFRPHLQRRIRGIPDTLHLFKIQLPQGACLLWELAVAFSPRLSESAENLLAMEPSTDDDTALKRGRVYSELIRIWNVVLKQSEVEPYIRKIVRSHQRGKDCIIQKKLKGVNCSEIPNSSTSDRFPNLYIETIPDKVSNENGKHLELNYFPPASAHRNEFHILKFYSFSSTLVSSILSNTDNKVDFPFRVTDIEHAIISLDSNTPLLLLGRSGTGKTTCCLYRLWGMFLCYWEQAMKFNIPLIPREVPEILQLENGDDGAYPAVKDTKPDQTSKESSVDEGAKLDDEEGEEDENDEILYEHLHQMFVTKNPVLCTEVEKNFLKLRHASTILHMHNTAAKKTLPNTLQEVDDVYFPLFLTSRQLLLMLDASIDGEPFFPRNEDLALKVEIPGWGTQEDIFNIAPLVHDFFMDSSDEDDEEDIPKKAKNPNSHSYRGQMKVNLRRECTYEVFAADIWPKIAKKVQLDCHASLAWMEIMSFIKGSYEALNTENGYLDKSQYVDVGRKRAPNFTGDRSKIYEAFLLFNNYKQQHFLFDEADLVFKLYSRLRTMTYIPWTLHEIYVDETQDFTQAELALLISISLDPNKMFLTGDTAQSIMRGISFRFIDLKSLFYYAKESAKDNEKYLASIKVPQKVHQLRYNYRSHTGILSLASSVLDILIEFFPESFDPLQKDQGMFAGPKPVVIESCSPADLALLITGNRRKTSHIEFGAHQAILVVNEEAKERIPEELRTGIVLTIFESKGLEFDDVLIYNFFKDSQANKEWRVVTTFLENLATRVNKEEKSDNLVELDTNVLCQYNRPRALAFDPNLHKLLNSELKHLYTALTRARVNVWIFDEDQEKRASMFEYFKALKLVKCMEVGNSESITEELMFADSSTPQEWKQAGDNYMKQRLYHVAAKCYSKAFQPEKEKIALAHHVALEASRLKTSPKEMREKYLTAGVKFLECSDLYKAGICFQNSRDYLLAALAYEKNGQFEEAAYQYRRLQDPQYNIDESSCLEKVGLYGRAVQVLVSAKLFDRAIDCLKRYKIQIKKLKEEGRSIPSVLIENKPSHSEENLCFSAAKYHHENKEHAKAKAAIARIKDLGMQIEFLKNHGYFSEAAQLMMEEGRTEEAATLVLRNGDADKALEYARDSMNKQQSAFINLVLARKSEKENFNLDSIKKHAKKALENYIDLQDSGGQAHAKLILGKHTCDPKLLKDAYRGFENEKPPNDVGRLESFSALMVMKSGDALSIDDCKWCLDSIKVAINLILNLTDAKGNRNEQKLSYLRFYGFNIDVSSQKVSWYPNEYPLCQDLMQSSIKEKANAVQVTVDKIEALTAIEKYAIGWIKSWSQILKHHSSLLLEQYLPCKNFLEGLPCTVQDEKHKHNFVKLPQEEKEIFRILNTSISLDFRMQTGLEELKEKAPHNTALIAELESLTYKDTCWDSVKNYLDFVFPANLPPTRDTPSFVKQIVQQTRNSKDLVNQVQRYFTFLWNNPGRVGKGRSQNVVKERCKTSDWIVQACLFSELFRFETLNVRKEVQDLETHLMTNFKNWTKKSKKYALFYPEVSKTSKEMLVETIGSRFLESMDYLKDNDPLEATFAFTKMISTLGWRNVLSLMPAHRHLIFWMEFYFTITWFFIGNSLSSFKDKSSKTSFYLSNSLLASVNLVNASLGDEENKEPLDKIQRLIVKYPGGKSKSLFLRQEHLCNFLVGHNEFSKFSLIGLFNTLCSGSQPQYQLGERILVLALCVLLNIPNNFVNYKYELPIRRELYKIELNGSMPAQLSLLINSVNRASGYHDVAKAISVYAHSRPGRSMFQCQWQTRESCPMTWEELKSYPTISMSPADLQELVLTSVNNLDQKQEPDIISKDIDENDIEKLEAKKKLADLEKLKISAVKKIIPVLRLCVMKTYLKKKMFRTYELKEMFQGFSISDTFCGVCGVVLGTEMGHPYEDGDASTILTKELHTKDESHQEAERELNTFKYIYSTEIYEQRDKIERFLLQRKVEEKSEIYQDIELDIAKVLASFTNFKTTLEDILSKRNWTERRSVLEAFHVLCDDFKEKQPKIEDQFNKSANKEEAEKFEGEDATHDITTTTVDELLEVEEPDRNQLYHQNTRSDRPRGRGRGRPRFSDGPNNNNRPLWRNRQNRWPDRDNYHNSQNYHSEQNQSYYNRNQGGHRQERNNDYGYRDYNSRRQNSSSRSNHQDRGDSDGNWQRPGRNTNNEQRYFSRNRQEFQRDLPPRFMKNFHQ